MIPGANPVHLDIPDRLRIRRGHRRWHNHQIKPVFIPKLPQTNAALHRDIKPDVGMGTMQPAKGSRQGSRCDFLGQTDADIAADFCLTHAGMGFFVKGKNAGGIPQKQFPLCRRNNTAPGPL